MRIDKFVQPHGSPKRVAVACAEGFEVLSALNDAVALGMIEPVLIGNAREIRRLIAENDFRHNDCEIVDMPDHAAAAKEAVAMARRGKVQALMKGVLVSAILMREILNKETGIRSSSTLNHVSLIDSPGLDRLLLMSDGGMVPYPTLKQKVDIINNTVEVARAIGIETPKVACLGALELVNPDMPATMDAAALAIMSQRGQIKNCIVDGPFQLDNALYPEAVREKGVKSSVNVAGNADILLVPNIESGNILLKGLRYLGGCAIAGLMAGAAVPVIMSSRADPPVNKLRSIGFAIAAAK